MTGASSVSGVDRYMEMLSIYMGSVEQQDEIRVLRICLISDDTRLRPSIETRGVRCLYIPLPCHVDAIIDEGAWMHRYGGHVLKIVQEYIDLDLPTIIHIHTLNLVDIALALKAQIKRAKIITHLHCIPWKGWINRNLSTFLRLYSVYYDNDGEVDPELFRTNRAELESYCRADHIVCLTECAQRFVSRICKGRPVPLSLIPNGLSDLSEGESRSYEASDKVKLVFIGALTRGKGLHYVLDAMCIAQRQGVSLQLDVAGASSGDVAKWIQEGYPDLEVYLHGSLNREEVVSLYKQADIGIIASLQEQCSYVAIEMAMMGLPIITTAVDGLDEMFTDEVNALKVLVSFSRVRGLRPDVAYMSECIVRLAKDKALRERLGRGARELYLERYTLDKMGRETMRLYDELLAEL